MARVWIAVFVAGAAASPQLQDGMGSGVSKSTYAATDPIAAKEFLLTYLPCASASDECTDDLCVCDDDSYDEAWYIYQGRVALTGSSFGIHLINRTAALTTGSNVSIADVEAQFTSKLGDMTAWDAFMDYNIMLYADSLDTYVTAFDSDDVPYLALSYEANGETWYSALVRVPGTILILEITAPSSTTLASRASTRPAPEPRLSDARARELREHARAGASASDDDSSEIYAIRVSRAASDLSAVDAFYQNVMGAALDKEYDADGVTRYCYKYESSSTCDVCFTKRSDDNTTGSFKVSDWEDAMNSVHAELLANPKCEYDLWLDNHHAIDYMQTDYVNVSTYLDSDAGKDIYYYCSPRQSTGYYDLHYVIDPTGWGVQLDTDLSASPSGCDSSYSSGHNLGGTYNPACNMGDCS